jgi:hypothetical protein
MFAALVMKGVFKWQKVNAANQQKIKLFRNLNQIHNCKENVSVQ